MATASEIKAFIIKLGGLAVNECNKRIRNGEGFILPSVCIAQSAIETGWGTSGLMTEANAYFGIKAGGSWTGATYNSSTREIYNGKSYNISANFRAYSHIAVSVTDYYDLLLNASRYSGAISHFPDKVLSASQTVRAIANAGYATDPLYYNKVYNTITARNLTTWDAQIDGVTVDNIPPDGNVGYEVIELNADKYKTGRLYVNNDREVLFDDTAVNSVSLLWENAVAMRKGTYTIRPAKGYTLTVIALSGETFETVTTESAWTNSKPYDKVAFTLTSNELTTLGANDVTFAIETTDVSMSNPNYKPVGDRVLGAFIKIS